MKGIDVAELFEKRGLGRHELVDAVYCGLHPIHFGAELVPHNCLSCTHADQDGLSHCRGAVGTANSRTEECGYTVLTDKEFYERRMDCEFVRSEVEEYLNDIFPDVRAILPRDTNVTVDKPEEGAPEEDEPERPHFATPEEVVVYCHGQGIHESHDIAREVDKEFTGDARLSDTELGRLLPAKGAEAGTAEGCRSQGKRLRKKYNENQ